MLHSPKTNKTLASFIVLLLLSTSFFSLFQGCKDTPGNKNNGESTSNKLDSASITRWDVIPKGNKAASYSVYKDSGIYWKIKMSDNQIVDADLKVIGRSLKHLAKLAEIDEAPLDKSKWKDEGIDDAGTKLIVFVNNQKADSFIVGKLEFINQTKSSYYIRHAGSDKTYMLKSVYIEGSALAQTESFRKREMVPVDSRFFKSLKIVAPGTNVYYMLENIKGVWSISGHEADQVKVLNYIKMLTMVQVPAFASPPASSLPGATIDIVTSYGAVKLNGYPDATGNWIVASTVNVGNYLKLNPLQADAVFPKVDFFEKR